MHFFSYNVSYNVSDSVLPMCLFKRNSHKLEHHSVNYKENKSKNKIGKDTNKDWTGLDFNSAQRTAEDSRKWRKIVEIVSSGARKDGPDGSKTRWQAM